MTERADRVKRTEKAETAKTGEKYDAAKLGLNSPSHAAVELNQTAANDAPAQASVARYHSVLAMEAARKMRRTRQKKKTGQQVCHHLKMMLTAEPPRASAAEIQAKTAAGQIQLGL